MRGAGAVAWVALLAGCTSSEPAGRATSEAHTQAQAAAVRARTAATSRSLLEQYDAVLARHPDEAPRLKPLRDAVAEHVKALAPGTPSAPASGPPASGAAAAPEAVPADPAAAVQSLATAERQAGRRQTAALIDAPPELARLLASVAAANAVHLYLLSRGARS